MVRRDPALDPAVWGAAFALLLALLACGGEPDEPAPRPVGADTASAPAPAGEPTDLEIRDVALVVAPGVVQHVVYLRGTEVSLEPDRPVVLDDPGAFEIRVDDAETAMTWSSLTTLMNDRVFAGIDLISDVTVGPGEDDDEPGTIEIEGRLNLIPPVEFEIEGTLTPSRDGNLRVRTTSVQAYEIEVGGLLDLIGVEVEDLLPKLEERGIRVEGDDMTLVLSRVMPPPRVRGSVTRVRVQPDRVVIGIGSAEAARAGWNRSQAHYLFHRHGTIRIGRMTMEDADLRVLDQDPSDPFLYSIHRMQEQHVAGFVKLQMDGGLVVHAPDLDDMER